MTDRTMRNAQKTIETLLASGEPSPAEAHAYLDAVRRYFTGFEREARAHLRDLDKRLEHVNQVHFNLTAERAVAARRIDATRSVLNEIEHVAHP